MIMEEVDMVVQEGTPEAAFCTIWKTCAGMIEVLSDEVSLRIWKLEWCDLSINLPYKKSVFYK